MGDLTINSSGGAVAGGDDGIVGFNNGTGALTISVDQVTGGTGIDADAASAGTATVINLASTAVVTGTTDMGIGAVTIDDIDLVTNQAGDGIDVVSVRADIAITAVDTISGTGGHGILARSDNGNISIQGSGLVGGISGSGATFDGINVNSGTGSINIGGPVGPTALGNVTGTDDGIDATNAAGGHWTDHDQHHRWYSSGREQGH